MGKSLKGKELGDGIVQRKDGRYEARFIDRFGKRKSISGRDLKDVKQRFNQAIYENSQEINIREEITLNKWYEQWMDVYKFDTIRKNTRRSYKQVYTKHISPKLGNKLLANITQLEVRKLLNGLKENGFGYETRNKVRILLVDMFNKAMIDEFARRNPAKGITIKRDEEREPKALTVDEQVTFFNCCKGTFYDNLFVVAVNTGMRIGELAGLLPEDIDWKNMSINVRRTLVYQEYEEDDKKTFHFEDPKTYTSRRTIPINKNCEKALKKQFMQKYVVRSKAPKSKKVESQFEDLLFTTKYNTPLNSQIVCDAIAKIVDEVNLTRDILEEMERFSCHAFRHTFAVRCFEAGIAPKTVQAYLGHATLQMTMDLYTTVLQDYKESEMEKLQNKLSDIEREADELDEVKYENWSSQNMKKVVNLGRWMAQNG